MAKGKTVSLRMNEEERKQLEQDAKKEQRSVSNLLLWCWKQWRGKK
jgi:uncharacterized protein (DUF1778 family)